MQLASKAKAKAKAVIQKQRLLHGGSMLELQYHLPLCHSGAGKIDSDSYVSFRCLLFVVETQNLNLGCALAESGASGE